MPKTVDEMFERVRAYIRGEVASGSAEMVRPSKGDKGYIRPSWSGGPKKARNRGGSIETRRNMGIYTSYPRKDTFTPLIKTPKEILSMESVSFPEPPPLIGTPEKQNLNKFCDYHGDMGERYLPKQSEEREPRKEQCKGHKHDKGRRKSNNKYSSNYGKGEKKQNGANEVHDNKMSFAIQCHNRKDRNEKPRSGRHLERVQSLWKEVQWRQREEKMSMIREQVILRTKSSSGRGPNSGPMPLEKTRGRENTKEVFTISHEHPNQSERTAVPRFIMEHQLNIYPLAEPVVHKKRLMTPDGRLVLKERGFRWLKEWMIKKVQHPVWVANTIPVKLANGTWKVQVNYSSLNKVCAMDMYPFPEEREELASIMGYLYKYFLRLPKECKLKNSAATLQRMMEKVLADQRGRNVEIYLEKIVIKSKNEQVLVQDVEETLRKLKRVNIKINPITSSFGVKEGRFLGHMVTKEGVRAYPEKVQAVILSLTPKNPNQIRSLLFQLTAINKFIPKMAELQYPIRKVRMKFETTEWFGWTNKAEKALQRIKRKLNKLQTLAVLKEGEIWMLCLRQKDETISFVLLVEREGIQLPVSYVSRPLQGMKICYTPTEKMVQALIYTTRSLRAILRKHKVKTYDISYIPRREAEGSVVKKFFGQGEQVEETPNANEGGTLNLSRKLQAKSTPTPRAWRLYLGREIIEEGSGVGIILVSPDEKIYSFAIRLKFNTSDHAIDCEALLAGLTVFVSKGMKDLHVFMDSPKLVAQTEGNHTPAMEQERKYKKEIMDATALFYRFWITHLPKILNSKAEVLTGLATIKLEFLNQ
ncbi:reverse transcriptase domain-containing protein [Tanacetum coccineum]